MSNQGPVRILKGSVSEYYHNVPGELELLTVTPEQQAIFQYLSAVGPDRFQEFVADILAIVEGHEQVDITGGPGDEKQDILSRTTDGLRQLTQCKHTVNFATKSSGDELDLMFGAAVRKNCRVALYVTNGDLTPQSKRYINDQEYRRGSSIDPALLPEMQYWTGRQIWERIASNPQILNKWFSGAAQVHGLRSFSLSLVATQMPSREVLEIDIQAIHEAFRDSGSPFTLTVDSWFSSLYNIPGAAGQMPLNSPVPSLRAQVTDGGKTGLFDLDAAVDQVASAALKSVEDPSAWMHLFASPPSAAFFVHDLRKPIMCDVGETRSLVRVGDEIEDEFTWSVDPGKGFIRSEEDSLSWQHEATGAFWYVTVEQRIGPSEAYAMALRQQQLIRTASTCAFWRLDSSRRNIELLQALASHDAMILEESGGHLLLAVEMRDGESVVTRLQEYCSRNEVPLEQLTEAERDDLVSRIENIPQMESKFVSQPRELEAPIDLTGRIVSLRASIEFGEGQPLLEQMLQYKIDYELNWGFDPSMGKGSLHVGPEEIWGRLFDFFTFRGERMLDIGFTEDREMQVVLRRRGTGTERASRIASEMLKEIAKIMIDLSAYFEVANQSDPA